MYLRRAMCIAAALIAVCILCSCKSDTQTAKQSEAAWVTQVDQQLQGTWEDELSEDFFSLWTFCNGHFAEESTYNGKKLKAGVGLYFIGKDYIYTVTIYDDHTIRGQIEYEFNNGVLTIDSAKKT